MDTIQKETEKKSNIQQEIVSITHKMDKLSKLVFMRDGLLIGMLGVCALMEVYSPKLKAERIPVGIFVAASVAYVGAAVGIRCCEHRCSKRLDALEKQRRDLEKGNE